MTDEWIVVFENVEDEDTLIYFKDSCEWHTHGSLFITEDGITLNDVPLMIMTKLLDGELLLIEQRIQRTGYKIDRYFDGKEGIGMSLNCIDPGETITIKRL